MARLHLFVFPVVFGSGKRLFAARRQTAAVSFQALFGVEFLAEPNLPAGDQVFPA
jgi:hypothetical protein